ncbi:hypothetical protein QTP88_023806 [Uroleucon formosanum]
MSYENIAMLQTKSFERQISTFIVSNNNQTEIESDLAPMLTTIKNHNLGYRIRCSVKNCFNRHSKDLSFFGCPSDFTLRKKWIEKCGLSVDPTKKVKLRVRVCRIHFDDDCFKNTKLKNRLRPGAVPSLFLDNGTLMMSKFKIPKCFAKHREKQHKNQAKNGFCFFGITPKQMNKCIFIKFSLFIYIPIFYTRYNFQNILIYFELISDISSKKQSDTSCGFKNGRPKQYYKSIATTDEMYFSRNEIKECTAFTNDLYHQPVDFSCVKIEPLVDDDLQTNSLKVLCLSQYN